jgi:branched-chain amino acid transport system ATP-binding protein
MTADRRGPDAGEIVGGSEEGMFISDLEVAYGPIVALSGVTIDVPKGSFISVIGANGAGKTTLVRTITGVLWLQGGKVKSGDVILNGSSMVGQKSSRIVRAGVGQVPEGRMLFGNLTVEENLRCGAATRRHRDEIEETLDWVWELFPQLAKLQKQTAGLLSGGEQQMVAVGRALMSKPQLLVCDELSLGLAPLIVQQLFELLRVLNEEDGVSVLVIEQNARLALKYSSYCYAFELGRVALEGPSETLRENSEIQEMYLGGSGDSREIYAKVRQEFERP